MSYERFYPNGWQSGESGGTPITPEALDHIEEGILNSAPAGYGYGGEIPNLIEVATDDALKTALDGLLFDMPDVSARQIRVAHSGAQAVNGVGGMGGQGTLYGSLYKHSNNYAVMRVCGYLGVEFLLAKSETWGEVAWLNPLMVLGVEYRTTERHNGKVVYAKRISYAPSVTIGTIGNVSDTDMPHGITGFTESVRCVGRVDDNLLPFNYGGTGWTTIASVTDSAVRVRVYNDTWDSGHTFEFDIYYVK